MSIDDILKQYANRPEDAHPDFDAMAGRVPREVLGDGVAQALRSDQTPPFGEMIGQLFGNSDGPQRAGLLNQLIRTAGPAVLSSIAGGSLGRLAQGGAEGNEAEVTPDEARQMTPEQIRDLAAEAEKKDPSVLDRVGAYYAQHPEVVKVLGGAALAVALGRMADRMRG